MSSNLQESYLTHLLIKALSLKPNRFLFQIMGEVQRCLYDKGIQLVEHRYNNGTEYIKFVADETAESGDSLESRMIQNAGEVTPSAMIEGQTDCSNVNLMRDSLAKQATQSICDDNDSVSEQDIEGGSRR